LVLLSAYSQLFFAANLSLPPLAAAFIAGYAVEYFFIFLDTILQAVQKPMTERV